MVEYSGPLWELNPVEVRARPRPPQPLRALPPPELAAFQQTGVDPAGLRAYLVANNLALAVVRDATTRDDFDRQQPFNLRMAGGNHQTIGAPGKIYDVTALQIFQGDQVRGWRGGSSEVRPGRRVLARVPHDTAALAANSSAGGPPGSAAVHTDGSIAAFVPAGRALTWQLTDAQGVGVVRERYWLTFQPGEIRVCGSCHGLSEVDQAGAGAPQNTPEALVELLRWWADDAKPEWQALAATQNGEIYGFPSDFFGWDSPDPRWILGLQWLATRLHPDRFAEVDMLEEVRSFFAAIYGMDADSIEANIIPALKGDVP